MDIYSEFDQGFFSTMVREASHLQEFYSVSGFRYLLRCFKGSDINLLCSLANAEPWRKSCLEEETDSFQCLEEGHPEQWGPSTVVTIG